MADVASALYSWSTNEASNAPAGSTTVGTGWDDNLRMIQKVTRGALAHKGADIASAGTTDLGAVEGLFHDITGTTTITGFGTVSAGIWKVIKFEGALTLTHNASSLIIPGGANITTADGDQAIVTSEGSGNWRVVTYVKASGGPILGSLSFLNITGATAETAPAIDDEVPIYDLSATANRKMTLANFLKVVNALTEDASPDGANDFLVTYDASASASKKVKLNNILNASAGASKVLLATGTASASASLDFAVDSTYDVYEFELVDVLPATNAVDFGIRISQDSGGSYKSGAANYSGMLVGQTDGASGVQSISNTGTLGRLNINSVSNATSGWSGTVKSYKPSGTALRHTFTIQGTGRTSVGPAMETVSGGTAYIIDTAAITNVRFIFSSGNIASGTIRQYGIRNS